MAKIKSMQFFVIKYEYEVSVKDEYNGSKRHLVMNEMSYGPRILNDKKYYVSIDPANEDNKCEGIDSVREDCFDCFSKICFDLATFPNCMPLVSVDGRRFRSSIDLDCYIDQCTIWDWVEERKISMPTDILDSYYAEGHYYDNCWKWSISVCIEKSGEHSRFHARNILLCLNNKGLSQILQMCILCYVGIMNNDFINPIEGAIEPY